MYAHKQDIKTRQYANTQRDSMKKNDVSVIRFVYVT